MHRWSLALGMTAIAWSIATLSSSLGALESWEYAFFDFYARYQPAREVDPRITVVTIDENDLFDATDETVSIGWPLPDAVAIEAIEAIERYGPRAIGLHLYFPPKQDAERDRLKAKIAATEHLIGMEKVVGSSRQAPSIFPREQLAMSDMVLDSDGTIRRGLVSIYDRQEKSYLSWGAQLALEYLSAEGVFPERQENGDVRPGRGTVKRLRAGDGGYSLRLDDGGFQILMDYRGSLAAFETISL